MKKILAVLLAVFTLTLAACSSELSPQEYTNRLTAVYEEYISRTAKSGMALLDIVTGDSEPDIAGISENTDKLESCLSEVEKLTPPAKYRDRHDEMCASIQSEREWLSAFRRIETEGYTDEIKDKLYEYSDREFSRKCLGQHRTINGLRLC